ncbi:NAD(P)-binding protein [Rhizodiscina lignyota]|uniref:NAD(P)-binding protein n=1 Tax=Rhizodiscina lignyota TaxID=1504668 RepID=A0A9P4IL60_9PEZI|nr:NAD(P)-binding protein [Rhizodiscina lignyota]
MPKTLIIGATGYIGQTLALSLLRSGHHTVYGVARSPVKARSLAALEIIPVICADPAIDGSPLLQAISEHRIDTVAVVGGDQQAHALLELTMKAGLERLELFKKAGVEKPTKLGFMYTSGTWVHGSSIEPVSDLDQVGNALAPSPPAKLVAWRADFEQEILAFKVRELLDVVIIRPGLLYGRSHAIWTMFFAPLLEAAKNGAPSVQIPLDADSRPGLIHVDDVGTGIHAAIEKIPEINGAGLHPCFDLVGQSESMRDIFSRLADVLGFKGKVELVGAGDNLFAAAMSTTGTNHAERARMILGWEPKRLGFVDGMGVYGKAFEASQ